MLLFNKCLCLKNFSCKIYAVLNAFLVAGEVLARLMDHKMEGKIRDLFMFKNFGGVFVKRRTTAF